MSEKNIYLCSSSDFNPNKGKLMLVYAKNADECTELIKAEVAFKKYSETEWTVAMVGYGESSVLVTVIRES